MTVPPPRPGSVGAVGGGHPAIPWAGRWPEVAPVTIVRRERWFAFPVDPGQIPPPVDGAGGELPSPYGVGDSPNQAYLDLARRLGGR